MSALELYCVPPVWTGRTWSEFSGLAVTVTMHDFWCVLSVKEKLRNGEMAVSGDQWPIFIYQGYIYDPEDPWNGLFRSTLLISVGQISIYVYKATYRLFFQAYKHIFTSPSSVEKEPKATRSGNARIHGMTQVTQASIAYVATQVWNYPNFDEGAFADCSTTLRPQVRFALSSSPVFSRTDTVTDSERFYNTVLDLFDDIEEKEEVNDLLTWWNR
jgi:hypothetical protein